MDSGHPPGLDVGLGRREMPPHDILTVRALFQRDEVGPRCGKFYLPHQKPCSRHHSAGGTHRTSATPRFIGHEVQFMQTKERKCERTARSTQATLART